MVNGWSQDSKPNKGVTKHLEKIERANKMKQDKKEDQDRAFASGSNWSPSLTRGKAPKLTPNKFNKSP